MVPATVRQLTLNGHDLQAVRRTRVQHHDVYLYTVQRIQQPSTSSILIQTDSLLLTLSSSSRAHTTHRLPVDLLREELCNKPFIVWPQGHWIGL
jgi:hypothetical protein